MKPRDLRGHRKAAKRFVEPPTFKPLKRGKLPRPFRKIGGPRFQATNLHDVSGTHVAFIYWRDGPTLEDRSFYAYLLCRLADGRLSPLFEFHWHPSHKPIHCKVPCKTSLDYTERRLPGAPELRLKTERRLDPADSQDRNVLIMKFCKACGIEPYDSDPISGRLC